MEQYSTHAESATTNALVAERRKSFNNLDQATRRRVAREVAAMWNDIGTAAGFTPIELRTAWAIEVRLDELGRGVDSPRWVSNAAIGVGLVSNTKDIEAAKRTARNRVGHLFNNAIPRAGYQILTRYKVGEDEQHPNEFVSHLMPVAAFFSELLAEEFRAINKLDSALRAAAKAEARERLITEALTYLPKCEAVILDTNGEAYAYVSGAEAKAYCAKKEGFTAQGFKPGQKPKKPLTSEGFDRVEEKYCRWIEDELFEISDRNTYDEARIFAERLRIRLNKKISSWAKVAGAPDGREREERGVELPTEENPVLPPCAEPLESAGGGEEKVSPLALDNSAEDNNLQSQNTHILAASDNFDSALEAALFYVKDGWAVVPCRDKKPLIGGKIKNAGHTAASRDKGLIREWFTEKFKGAGVAIRLDGHILLDVDVKDGKPGLASYDTLADTFDLPATLTQLTPSGGRHHIFKLPDSLPAGYLGNWTDFLAAEGLGGIDIKTGTGGLCHVEPTRTDKGVYRWVDPTADIAELPMALCEYFHGVHKQEEDRKQAERAANATRYASTSDKPFDPDDDQGKYFKDAANGERRPRLRTIACSLAARGANENQIVDVLKYHDGRFSQPTNDVDFMLHVAAGAVTKFGAEVQQ